MSHPQREREMGPYSSPIIEPGTGVLHGVCLSATGTYEARVVLQGSAAPVVFPISEAKARELGPCVGRLLDVSLSCWLAEAERQAAKGSASAEAAPPRSPSGDGEG
mgnify:CR=1 FL=1